jgi:hypothetical protein
MAVLYVRSTDGDNASDGTTWALAKLDGAGAAAIDTAGDRIFFSDNHAESTAAAISWAWAGTVADPTKIICGDDSAEPPTAVAATGTVTTTGNSNITCASGGYSFFYGLTFIAGSGASGTATINAQSGSAITNFANCSFQIATTGTSSRTKLNLSSGVVSFDNCTFKFAATAQGIQQDAAGSVIIKGGSLLSGGSSPTALITSGGAGAWWLIDGLDLTNAAAGINLAASSDVGSDVTFRNCKLPASWSGSINSSTPGIMSRYSMYNCDSGDTNYRLWIKTQLGEITSETTIIKTGGASDGTTGLSWKMVSNANAEYPLNLLCTDEIVQWNETTGSAITVTVDIVHDSVTNIQNDEIWLEVQYLGTSGVPLGIFISDAAADILATPADQTDSSSTWTTTGLTNPNTQQLNVTFTPQEKGYIYAKVCLALASKTVYVDFEPVVT